MINDPVLLKLDDDMFWISIADSDILLWAKGLALGSNFDVKIIDGFGPDGVSKFVKKCSIKAKEFQSGFIYQYAFVMLLGFTALLTFLIIK